MSGERVWYAHYLVVANISLSSLLLVHKMVNHIKQYFLVHKQACILQISNFGLGLLDEISKDEAD